MRKAKLTARELADSFNSFAWANDVEVFYPGIRVDFAIFCGLPGNCQEFHAVFDRLHYLPSGPGILQAYPQFEES